MSRAPTVVDHHGTAAIEAAVRDYFEGWFEGDAARMERALHPSLVKRSLRYDASVHALWLPIPADR